jgi:hypothetical protein
MPLLERTVRYAVLHDPWVSISPVHFEKLPEYSFVDAPWASLSGNVPDSHMKTQYSSSFLSLIPV